MEIRPPALERDFQLSGLHRELRHVIEPELTYHFVGGIGTPQRNVLLVDTNDISTDTNELGFSLMQRFYARRRPCVGGLDAPADEAGDAADGEGNGGCASRPRG